MQALIEQIIQQDEGGWVLHKVEGDRGGTTYGGMTFRTFVLHFPEYTEEQFVKEALANGVMLKDRIRSVYNAAFVVTIRATELPPFIQPAILSMAINFGVRKAGKTLQNSYNVAAQDMNWKYLLVDGIIGSKTITALNLYGELPEFHETIQHQFCNLWQAEYARIVQHDHTQAKFLTGWLDRANRYRRI